jgi:RNA polymerase sigma factor (sigma-70 family)
MSDAEGVAEYNRIVNEHSRAILRYALRRLSDWSNCEDVVSETFLIAWRRLDQLPPRDRELAWLYAIALRVLSNQRRSRDRRDRLTSRLALERVEATAVESVDASDFESVMNAVKKLRRDDQILLEHVYWEHLTYREIAVVLEISENAVGIRINRAKKNLRALLGHDSEQNRQPGNLEREAGS